MGGEVTTWNIAIQNLTAGATRAIGFGWLFDIGDL
jgi:hypothetical protein